MRGLITFACAGVFAVGLALSPKAASALPATPALNVDGGGAGLVEPVKSKKWNKKYSHNRNWNRGRYYGRGYGYRNYGYRNYGYARPYRPYGYYGYNRRPGVNLWFGF